MRVYQRDFGVTVGTATATTPWSLMEIGVISGGTESERAGCSVSISADVNGTEGGGSVLSFRYNDLSSAWEPYGSTIQGPPGAALGYSISLSENGSTLAVGSPKASNSDGAANAGKTAVYRMSRTSWQLLGQELSGEAEIHFDGTSFAISDDGSILAIGGKGQSELDLQSEGHFSVYQLQVGRWQFQHSIAGKVARERLGHSAAVSPDGNVVACGGVGGTRDGDSARSGVVRLWNQATLQESTIWPRVESDDLEGAAFGISVALSSDGEHVIVYASTWSGANGEENSLGVIQIFRLISQAWPDKTFKGESLSFA